MYNRIKHIDKLLTKLIKRYEEKDKDKTGSNPGGRASGESTT
jgi:hypothetical protein